MRSYNKYVPSVTIVLLLLTLSLGAGHAVRAITSSHWSARATEALTPQQFGDDIVADPDQPISTGNFMTLLSLAFDYEPESGAMGAQAEPISRGRGVAYLIEALELKAFDQFATGRPPTFSDITEEDGYYGAVETAAQLGILPPFIQGVFQPNTALTQGEAAWLVYTGQRLSREHGQLTYVDAATQRLTLHTDNDRLRDFRGQSHTLIIRDGTAATFPQLAAGDAVTIVADRYGVPRLIQAEKQPASANWAKQAARIITEVFTTEELQRIVSGDWSVAATGLQRAVSDRLLATGLTETEVQSVLSQDWPAIRSHVADELTTVISEQLHISPTLAGSLLQQDWETAKEQAQVEVVQHLLNRLLSTLDTPA